MSTRIDSARRAWRSLRPVWDFLLPPACVGCRGLLGSVDDHPVCANCRLGLRGVPGPKCARCGAPLGTGRAPACLECADWPDWLAGADAAATLDAPASRLVHALKYQGWQGAGRYMGSRMAREARPDIRSADFVVPVPTTPRRERRRGYNQARVIAESLAAGLGIPLIDALSRPEETRTQIALKPHERWANVKDAFSLGNTDLRALSDSGIILVDDVITTGATARAAATTLRQASPGWVFVYAFARRIPLQL